MKLKLYFKKLTHILKDSRGFSIAEVMVAAGLLGVVSLGVMEITKVQTKTQKRASADLDMNQIFTDISLILKDPQNCIASLSNDADAPNQTASGTAFKTYVPQPTGTQNRIVNLWRVGKKPFTDPTEYIPVGIAYVPNYVPVGTDATYTLGSSKNIRIASLVLKAPSTPTVTAWSPAWKTLPEVEVVFGVKSTGEGLSGKAGVTQGTGKEVTFKRMIKLTIVPDASNKIYSCMRDELNEAQDNCDLYDGKLLPDDDDTSKQRCKSIKLQTAPTATTAISVKGNAYISDTLKIDKAFYMNTTPSNNLAYIHVPPSTATITLGPKLQFLGDSISATGATYINLGGTSVAPTTMILGNGSTATANIRGTLNWGPNATGGQLSTDPNGAIELGPMSGGGSRSFIDFHTDGLSTDYNSRLIAQPGSFSIISAGNAVNINSATANITTTGNTAIMATGNATIDAAGVARVEGASAILAAQGSGVLNIPAGGADASLSVNLTVPTADFVYGTNMNRAVNKNWVYNVLTTTAADSFFSTAAKDAIIDQILNDATGQGNYNILRNNILDYLPTRSQMGVAGALKVDLGTNKQYWGTHCPGGYQIRATAYDAGNKQYFVECAPDCQNAGAPCPNVYVSSSLNVTGQICLNGQCKTSWGGIECGVGRFMYGLSAKGYPMCRNIGFAP